MLMEPPCPQVCGEVDDEMVKLTARAREERDQRLLDGGALSLFRNVIRVQSILKQRDHMLSLISPTLTRRCFLIFVATNGIQI